jgi:hypothetical protein
MKKGEAPAFTACADRPKIEKKYRFAALAMNRYFYLSEYKTVRAQNSL